MNSAPPVGHQCATYQPLSPNLAYHIHTFFTTLFFSRFSNKAGPADPIYEAI